MEKTIESEEFQNWMKCVSAQNETRKALCEVVEKRWKGFISHLTEEERGQIETFLECVKSKNIKYLTKDLQEFCSHSACASILHKLLKLLKDSSVPGKDQSTLVPDQEYSSNISPPDPCYGVYWDIAKLYLLVEDGITKHDGLEELDVCHVVQMMIDCELFAFQGSTEAYKSICEDRNELLRTGDYSISDKKRQSILEHMSNVLSHFNDEEFYTCIDVKEVIQENQNKDWTKEYEFEYKRIARQMLEIKLAAVESDIQENEHLEDILEKTKTDLDEVIDIVLQEEAAEPRDEILETEKLKIRPQDEDKTELLSIEKEQQLLEMEREICMANLKNFMLDDPINICHTAFKPQDSSSNAIKVTSFGNFQDLFVQIDGISVLFDPLDPRVIKGFCRSENSDYTEKRDALHSLPLDAVVLSTCINGFNATTVQKIVEKSPGIKWLIPKGIKCQLVEMGITESSIRDFGIWDEKVTRFGNKRITFACTPTHINRTFSSHNKKCNSCGWIIKGSKQTFYSSGITNYHQYLFKEVTKRFNHIHVAVLPVSAISCVTDFQIKPNESVQIHKDIRPEQSLGVTRLNRWYYELSDASDIYSLKIDQEVELVQEMKKLNVATSKFNLLIVGETYGLTKEEELMASEKLRLMTLGKSGSFDLDSDSD